MICRKKRCRISTGTSGTHTGKFSFLALGLNELLIRKSKFTLQRQNNLYSLPSLVLVISPTHCHPTKHCKCITTSIGIPKLLGLRLAQHQVPRLQITKWDRYVEIATIEIELTHNSLLEWSACCRGCGMLTSAWKAVQHPQLSSVDESYTSCDNLEWTESTACRII